MWLGLVLLSGGLNLIHGHLLPVKCDSSNAMKLLGREQSSQSSRLYREVCQAPGP